jgi:hypothetical protein
VSGTLQSSVFFILLYPFFFGIGRLLRGLFPDPFKTGLAGFLASSCIGVAVAAVGAQWLYFANVSVERILILGIVVAAGGWALQVISLYRGRSSGVAEAPGSFIGKIRVGLLVAGTVLLVLPRFTGGQQFAVFQWSHLDTSGYLIPSATYQLLPYRTVRDTEPVLLEQEGGFRRAQWQLAIRPAVRILYATVTAADRERLLHNGYLFLCYFLSLALGIGMLLFDVIAGRELIRSPLLALAVIGGFWGQYIVDINSWSHVSVIAILLLVTRLVIGDETSLHRNAGSPRRSVVLTAILLGGSFYLYPEATAFYLPGLCLVALSHCLVRRRPAGFVYFMATVAATAMLLAPCFRSTVGCLFRQVNYVRVQDAAWSRHFLISLSPSGNDPVGIVVGGIDGLMRVLGLYYLVPSGGELFFAFMFIAVAAVVLAVALSVVLGRNLWIRAVANGFVGPLVGLVLVTGTLLAQVFALELTDRSWAAGKGLSYASPLMMILLLCPCILALPRSRVATAITGTGAAYLLAAFHLAFAAARPIAAMRPHGIHFSAPYPSVSDPLLKTGYDWSDFQFTKGLTEDDLVAVNIDIPWIRYYVRIALQIRDIPYFVTTPVYAGLRETTVLGYTVPPGPATVELNLTPGSGGNRIVVTARRL